MKTRIFTILALALAALLLVGDRATLIAAEAEADSLDTFLESAQRAEDVRIMGIVVLSLRNPAMAEAHRKEVAKNYWAFRPDVKLTPAEDELELTRFNGMYDALVATVKQYEVDELFFAGYDDVAIKRCQDWYYAALTPRGPVLIRISIMFKDSPRIFNMETITGWDEVKRGHKAIEHRAGEKIMRISLNPPKDDKPGEGDKPAP